MKSQEFREKTLQNLIAKNEQAHKEIEILRKELCEAQANGIECRNEINRLEALLLEAGLGTYI